MKSKTSLPDAGQRSDKQVAMRVSAVSITVNVLLSLFKLAAGIINLPTLL